MSKTAAPQTKPRRSIIWENKREPFGERLYAAIEYLRFRHANCNARAACETIEKIVGEREKHRLYQKFFPVEWRKSRASCFKSGFYENYSERANEFFGLINENLFPLLSGWNEDPEMDFEHFHIFSLNFDMCCEEIEYDHVRASCLFGLAFFIESDELWETLKNRYNIRRKDLPKIRERPHEKLWHGEFASETSLYRDLFELVDHSTGNPWLDTYNCCHYGDVYGWKEETILELAKAFAEAKELLERINRLDEIIESRPQEAMLDLIRLWNTGELKAE